MRARVKKTNEVVKLRPSLKEKGVWLTEDDVPYRLDEIEPIRVEAATMVGTVQAIPLKIITSASGGISDPNEDS